MKSYQSQKVVEAAVISGYTGDAAFVYEDDKDAVRVDVPENFFARGFPASGDYLVRYGDGYLSWSPKAAFEEGYSEVKAAELQVLGVQGNNSALNTAGGNDTVSWRRMRALEVAASHLTNLGASAADVVAAAKEFDAFLTS